MFYLEKDLQKEKDHKDKKFHKDNHSRITKSSPKVSQASQIHASQRQISHRQGSQ